MFLCSGQNLNLPQTINCMVFLLRQERADFSIKAQTINYLCWYRLKLELGSSSLNLMSGYRSQSSNYDFSSRAFQQIISPLRSTILFPLILSRYEIKCIMLTNVPNWFCTPMVSTLASGTSIYTPFSYPSSMKLRWREDTRNTIIIWRN